MRPRWSVRGLAVFAAIIGMTLGAAGLEVRRRSFLEIAEGHASRALDYEEGRATLCLHDEFYEPGSRRLRPEAVRYLDAMRSQAKALDVKYRRAALRPWEGVGPDPPAPEPAWSRGDHAD